MLTSSRCFRLIYDEGPIYFPEEFRLVLLGDEPGLPFHEEEAQTFTGHLGLPLLEPTVPVGVPCPVRDLVQASVDPPEIRFVVVEGAPVYVVHDIEGIWVRVLTEGTRDQPVD